MKLGFEGARLQACHKKLLRVPALAAEGTRTSHVLDAAEAAPLQLRWTWWALVPLLFAAAVIAAPYFPTHGFPAIGLALYRGFAVICHQRPERSFYIFGGAVAVCARCLGIYLGAAFGLLFRTSRTLALRLLIAAAALNFLDAITELAGLHGNWLAIRFVFGLILGAAGALLISSAIAATSDSASLAADASV